MRKTQLRPVYGRAYLSDYDNQSTVVFLFYFGLIARKKNSGNNKIVEMKTQCVLKKIIIGPANNLILLFQHI